MDSLRTLKIARNGYIVMSLVFCAVGICMIAQPESAAKFLCTIIGVTFIIHGIVKIVGYFSRDFYCLAFQFDLALGILTAAVGAVILARQDAIMHLLFAVLGLMILVDSLFRIQMSGDAKKFGLSEWWKILIIAIVTGVFGMVLLVDPFSGVRMTMILAGIAFVAEGCLNLCVVFLTVKVLQGQFDQV